MKNSFIEQPRRGNTHEVLITPDKAEGRSVGRINTHAGRSVWTVAAMLILAIFAVACDPGYTEDVAIRNASSHYVTKMRHRITSPSFLYIQRLMIPLRPPQGKPTRLPPMRKSSLGSWAASAALVSTRV